MIIAIFRQAGILPNCGPGLRCQDPVEKQGGRKTPTKNVPQVGLQDHAVAQFYCTQFQNHGKNDWNVGMLNPTIVFFRQFCTNDRTVIPTFSYRRICTTLLKKSSESNSDHFLINRRVKQ